MSGSQQFRQAVDVASERWGSPIRDVRLLGLRGEPVQIDALWTDGGLRPGRGTLACLIQNLPQERDLELWKRRLAEWPIRGGLLVGENLYLLQGRSDSEAELECHSLDLEQWKATLVSPKPHLFTPRALSIFRSGQLSLSDLEDSVSPRSFTYLLRQQTQIDHAFQSGIHEALGLITSQSPNSSRSQLKGHLIRFAIAYLAARILEDKSFFGNQEIQVEDPITLLDRMIEFTNGFFSRARTSTDHVPVEARQILAAHLGYRVSFALTDHRDVGRLYEKAITALTRQTSGELQDQEWTDLNRHYTPVKIAERMLEMLPLERLRPEERYIFDPAAGSGSLLLAATARLAGMVDIPKGGQYHQYLSDHIAGNNLDRHANLIAQLRYFLASESLGNIHQGPEVMGILPFPRESNFIHEDYETLEAQSLPITPRVIVANPPFSESKGSQSAARFIEKAISWLRDGSLFAFIAPQSILTGSTHGVSKARNLLTGSCNILEVWQLPEGTVGVQSRQSVCLISGEVGKSRVQVPTISRGIFAGAKLQQTRENGFLGRSWFIETDANGDLWSRVSSPPIKITVPTVPLVEKSYRSPKWIYIQRTGTTPELEEWQSERRQTTLTVIGQVLETDPENQHVLLYLSGLIDEEEEGWVRFPQELPAWAMDGTVFEADMSEDIETFAQLAQRPWALRRFRHTPRPYLTDEELQEVLTIKNLEMESIA